MMAAAAAQNQAMAKRNDGHPSYTLGKKLQVPKDTKVVTNKYRVSLSNPKKVDGGVKRDNLFAPTNRYGQSPEKDRKNLDKDFKNKIVAELDKRETDNKTNHVNCKKIYSSYKQLVISGHNEDRFEFQRKQGAGGSWSTIATTGANATSYSDSGDRTSVE